ncbi:MAG: hypothetical protein mread185_000201 [Mycoplasmataceae bacterium]|nr:MAG: hypothetical protein mread185_000201 [Mycoplasmataceae bacterium]
MTKKERCKFWIKFFVKEKDENLVRFDEKICLNIEWKNNVGFISPNDSKVWIRKNGKDYNFLVKIYELKKGWFYDKINGLSAEGGLIPDSGSNFTIVLPVSQKINEENMPREAKKRRLWEKDSGKESNLITPIQLRWLGPIFIIVSVLTFLFVGHRAYRSKK